MNLPQCSLALLGAALLAACASGPATVPATSAETHYGTKTPYRPQQDTASYQKPPPGFELAHVQLLARHGSRGLSSPKGDLLVYDLWSQADAARALTPLGRELGPDVMALIRANALLGYQVEGISKPGYGNLTRTGISEHQQLAQRLYARSSALLAQSAREVQLFSSGRDRAVDSAANFAQALLAAQPALNIARTQPGGAPRVTVDRFRLYFHKLNPRDDTEPAAGDPLRAVWLASQAYQGSQDDPRVKDKAEQAEGAPAVRAAARTVLERLFNADFIAKLDAGQVKAVGGGSFPFTSADGRFSTTVTLKDREAPIIGSVSAAMAIHSLYSIASGMRQEVSADFSRYMPAAAAEVFETVEDSADFYEKGPSITERGDLTWAMSQALFDDFFDQVQRVASGDLKVAARLRFAHAEHIVPLVSKLGLKAYSQQLPLAQNYSHANSAWRGDKVATMAANIQWEAWRHADGRMLVRMLHNERETDFQAACDGAKLAAGSPFYDWSRLKACYGK